MFLESGRKKSEGRLLCIARLTEVFDSLNYLQCDFHEKKNYSKLIIFFFKEVNDQFQLEGLGRASPQRDWRRILAGG